VKDGTQFCPNYLGYALFPFMLTRNAPILGVKFNDAKTLSFAVQGSAPGH
jgi:hypothetical protein